MQPSVDTLVPKTAKPIVAGVFNIVVGAFCILGALSMGIGALFFIPVSGDMFGRIPFGAGLIFLLAAIPLIVLGVISIIGGIYNLQRRMWGWALAGSITTAITSNVLGIVSIVLTAISKNEFTQ